MTSAQQSRLPYRDPSYTAGIAWLQHEPPGEWTRRAECRRYPQFAALFTDVTTFEDADVGLTICADCPVRARCLDYGRDLRADGVWGGHLLYRGRVKLRTARTRAS